MSPPPPLFQTKINCQLLSKVPSRRLQLHSVKQNQQLEMRAGTDRRCQPFSTLISNILGQAHGDENTHWIDRWIIVKTQIQPTTQLN